MKKIVFMALALLLINALSAFCGDNPFWDSVWQDKNPDREIPAEEYHFVGDLKKQFAAKGYDDCVQIIRSAARDDRITEGELKKALSCEGKYKVEEEKQEILKSLKE